MALYKELIDNRGVVSHYHRIANISQNFMNSDRFSEVFVYHYAEAKYREFEKVKIVEDADFKNITGTDSYVFEMDDLLGATISDFYNRMVDELEEYAEATEI